MKTEQLRRIAEVQIGYQHREKVVDVVHGSHRLIQGKDLVRSETLADGSHEPASWRVFTQKLDRVTPRGEPLRYQLRPNDILFVARGTTNIAVPLNAETLKPYPEDWKDLIAAYTFYVLRPDQSRILPEYLAWYINQEPAQAFLAEQSRGTLVKLLPKNVFEELEVRIPSLSLQQKIVEIDRLQLHEEGLLQRLIAAKRRLIQQTCLDAIEAQMTEDTK